MNKKQIAFSLPCSKNSRAVIQYDLAGEYLDYHTSVTNAMRALNLPLTNTTAVCSALREGHGVALGFKWKTPVWRIKKLKKRKK